MGLFTLFPPSVVELDGKITVKHVSMKAMENDIKRIYRTSRVNSYMFTSIGRNSFVIESFFALEMHFILEQLINNRRVTSNVRTLGLIKRGLKENTWLRDIDLTPSTPERLDLRRLTKMSYPPLPYQLDFLKTYSTTVSRFHLKGMLLAGSAGSGKTYTSLALAECISADRIVIICQNIAINRVWETNIKEVFKVPQTYWFYSSGKPYRGERIAIYHYEALDKAFNDIDQLRVGTVAVILDESHNLTEMKALRTQRFIELCGELGSQDIILASGTPVKATAIETVPLFKAIDPFFTDEVMGRFKKMYQGEANAATEILAHRLNIASFKIEKAALGLQKPIFKEIKVQTPDSATFTLKAIADDMAIFVKGQKAKYAASAKADREFFYHCIGLAEAKLFDPNFSKRYLEDAKAKHHEYLLTLDLIIAGHNGGRLSALSKEMAFCNKYEKECIIPNLPTKEYRDRFKETKALVKYVTLKIQGECLGRVLGRKRIEAHLAMVPYVDFETIFNSTTKKTVLFTSYVEVVEACNTLLRHAGYSPVCVYGKFTGQLHEILTEFESKEAINPLIATYASLSTAVPLIMADTMVMINAPFRNYILEQTVSRIHRLGADTQTCIFTLMLDTGTELNISTRSVDILKWSQEQIEKILQIDVPFKIEDADDETSVAVEMFSEPMLAEFRYCAEQVTTPAAPTSSQRPLLYRW